MPRNYYRAEINRLQGEALRERARRECYEAALIEICNTVSSSMPAHVVAREALEKYRDK